MLQEELNRIKKMMKIFEEDEAPAAEPAAAAPSSAPSSGGGDSGGGASGYPTVTKWDSGVKRGKGNTIDQKSKWDSGVTRGKGNQIGVTKWESVLNEVKEIRYYEKR